MDFAKLKQFALSEWLHDLKLIFKNSKGESHEIPSHKIVLASHSDFLFHLFKENPNLKTLELPISIDSYQRETSLEDCQKILQFVYSGKDFEYLLSDLDLNFQNSLNYFAVSKLLGLQGLEKQLSSYILNIGFKKVNEIESLKNTIKFGNEQWEEDLMRRIARKFQQLAFKHETEESENGDDEEENESLIELNKNRQKLINLPLKNFSKLLERNDLNIENEDVVLKLVIDYIKMREDMDEKAEDFEESESEVPLYDYKKIFADEYYKNEFEEKKEKETQKGSSKKKGSAKKEKQDDEESLPEEPKNEGLKDKEQISFDTNWNSQSVEYLKNFKLSTSEKRNLLKKVRLSFVSHSYLIQVTREKILQEFTDLILEAMSLKLSKFETSGTDYTINCQPRNKYIPFDELNPDQFVRRKIIILH
jgi:hypothetical protein